MRFPKGIFDLVVPYVDNGLYTIGLSIIAYSMYLFFSNLRKGQVKKTLPRSFWLFPAAGILLLLIAYFIPVDSTPLNPQPTKPIFQIDGVEFTVYDCSFLNGQISCDFTAKALSQKLTLHISEETSAYNQSGDTLPLQRVTRDGKPIPNTLTLDAYVTNKLALVFDQGGKAVTQLQTMSFSFSIESNPSANITVSPHLEID